MTSRELVYSTLEFRNTSDRVPRELWMVPWSDIHHHDAREAILRDFPNDITTAPTILSTPTAMRGDAYVAGEYIDDWGCRFHNIMPGVHGEVKKPILPSDLDWTDTSAIHIPEELLTFDRDAVNRFCGETDKFVLAGALPRPFEQLQFIRGSEQLYVDLMLRPDGFLEFIKRMHDLYCRLFTEWAKTDVDGLFFMDDWGSQKSLLVSPTLWHELFLPMYKDYIDIAHSHGKKAFMHSDGYTLDIIGPLIGAGLDALNAQIFCIGIDKLARFRGQLTFWGEIDRQQILPYATVSEVEAAVRKVYDTLWQNGGCIALCEFGAGAKPENVRAVFDTWNVLR